MKIKFVKYKNSYKNNYLYSFYTVGVVHVKPVWTILVKGVEPPVELVLLDGVKSTSTCPCSAMTRGGNSFKNQTSYESGLCWRHRTEKCSTADVYH